jgi:hypothetical protein
MNKNELKLIKIIVPTKDQVTKKTDEEKTRIIFKLFSVIKSYEKLMEEFEKNL